MPPPPPSLLTESGSLCIPFSWFFVCHQSPVAMDIGKGWDGQKARWVGRLNRSDGKITVGVCAREKKARSKHMEAITSRLNREKFEVCGGGFTALGLRVYYLRPRSLRSPQAVGSSAACTTR